MTTKIEPTGKGAEVSLPEDHKKVLGRLGGSDVEKIILKDVGETAKTRLKDSFDIAATTQLEAVWEMGKRLVGTNPQNPDDQKILHAYEALRAKYCHLLITETEGGWKLEKISNAFQDWRREETRKELEAVGLTVPEEAMGLVTFMENYNKKQGIQATTKKNAHLARETAALLKKAFDQGLIDADPEVVEEELVKLKQSTEVSTKGSGLGALWRKIFH